MNGGGDDDKWFNKLMNWVATGQTQISRHYSLGTIVLCIFISKMIDTSLLVWCLEYRRSCVRYARQVIQNYIVFILYSAFFQREWGNGELKEASIALQMNNLVNNGWSLTLMI